MSTPTFYIKTADLLPIIRAQLIGAGGAVQKLPAGVTVRFHMKNSAGSVIIDKAATIENADRGIASYSWASPETDVAGTFTGEFEVTIAGKTMSFPNDQHITIYMLDDLDAA